MFRSTGRGAGVRVALIAFFAFFAFLTPAGAVPGRGPWSAPVDGPVVRGFDPPATRFGPGHLGVDYSAPPGTPVRAAGDGVVAFAGRVGSGLHVVVRHPGDIRTTASFLAAIVVVAGQAVSRGTVVGTSGGTGPAHGSGVLHFGVRVGAGYIDPMLLFVPPDLAVVVHLAEPRHGAAAAATQSGSGLAGERAALAAGLRVDARPLVAPPEWWGTEPPFRGPAGPSIVGSPSTSPSRAERSRAPSGAPVPAAAGVAGAAMVAGLGAAWRLRARRERAPVEQ